MVITNGHAMVLQTMADLKQKHKTALADRQEQARVRQQGVDTQLAEKGKALAVAQKELQDTKAASEQASQVCHSSCPLRTSALPSCQASLVCSCVHLSQSLHRVCGASCLKGKSPLCAQVHTHTDCAGCHAYNTALLLVGFDSMIDLSPWHLLGK